MEQPSAPPKQMAATIACGISPDQLNNGASQETSIPELNVQPSLDNLGDPSELSVSVASTTPNHENEGAGVEDATSTVTEAQHAVADTTEEFAADSDQMAKPTSETEPNHVTQTNDVPVKLIHQDSKQEYVPEVSEPTLSEEPVEEITHMQSSPEHRITVDLQAEETKLIVSKPLPIAPIHYIVPSDSSAVVSTELITEGSIEKAEEHSEKSAQAMLSEVEDESKQSLENDPNLSPKVEEGDIAITDAKPVHIAKPSTEEKEEEKKVETTTTSTPEEENKPKKRRTLSFKRKEKKTEEEHNVKNASPDRARGGFRDMLGSLGRNFKRKQKPPAQNQEQQQSDGEVSKLEPSAIEEPKPSPITSVEITKDDHIELEQEKKLEARAISTGALEVAQVTLDDTIDESRRKKHRTPSFKINLRRSREKKSKDVVTKENRSLDRERGSSLGRNFHSFMGALGRSIKRKEQSPQRQKPKQRPEKPQEIIQPIPRPARPAPIEGKIYLKPTVHSSADIDEQSLQSVSGPSLSNTPETQRRKRIESAMTDLIQALPTDGESTEVHAEVRVEGQEELVLKHVADDIAQTGSKEVIDGSPVHEAEIDPVNAKRQALVDQMVLPDTQAGQQSVADVGGICEEPPRVISKPPRPSSRPGSSPVDYDPYHQPTVQMTPPPGPVPVISHSRTDRVEFGLNSSPKIVPRLTRDQVLRSDRPHTASLDRRDLQVYDNGPSSGPVVRSQTLRQMDYADRMRERVKSLRVTSHGSVDGTGETLRPRGKPLVKRETYVCTDTFKWPKIPFKFKRRQTLPPKQVFSTPDDPVVRRPQPNIEPMFITQSHQPAPCFSMPNEDYSVPSPIARDTPYGNTKSGIVYSSNRQLTSIRAVEEYATKIPHVSREIGFTTLVEDSTLANQAAQLREVLQKVQPFLKNWTASPDGESKKEEKPEETAECIQNYLNTCARLRSVDLQGPFAAFQYPLPTFDRRQWRLRARLPEWNDLEILTEPDQQTEYIQLIPEKHLVYNSQSVDSLLTNWLDYHVSGDKSNETYVNARHFPQAKGTVFHHTLVVASLDQMLKCDNFFDSESKNQLLHKCLRLAVLLSYEACCGHPLEPKSENVNRIHPSSKPQDVLIALSTSNCLVLFRKGSAELDSSEGDSNAPIDLVKSLCPDHDTIEKAIGGLIKEIHTIITEKMTTASMLPTLLAAIAPPDWTAMFVARIALHPNA